MKNEDVVKLFDLLERLYQGRKRPRDTVTLSIWASVLKPWSYEEVCGAVIQRARTNRYFPDPSEIAALLSAREGGDRMRKYARSCPECCAGMKERAATLRRTYHDADLPTAAEAKTMGISHAAWRAMVDQAFSGEDDPPEM